MGSRLEIETPSQLASVIGDIAVLIEQNVAARGRILISPSASAGLKLLSGTFGLQPHRTETFKLSRDPLFIDKVREIVGL